MTDHPSPLLDDELRHLVRIAAAVAAAPAAVVRRAMLDALGAVRPGRVDEVLLQSYLFAGFPRTLNAARLWREISGVAAPAADPSADPRPSRVVEWARRGEEACRTVYGPVYEALRDSVRALHPALDVWMVTEGYGKVLSRPGLTLLQRELCIVAACAAAEQTPQLHSHLRGALNCGATHDDLAQTLAALGDIVPRSAVATAREELARLRAGAAARGRARELHDVH